MRPCVLVVGYGNELRGDDGVGPRVARAVAAWKHPGIQALALPQLFPELSETLKAMDRVLFVDAAADERLRIHYLLPGGEGLVDGHFSDPRGLLALTAALHGRCPSAWLITVPAANFDHGETLSPLAERGMVEALHQVELLLHNQSGWCARMACTGQTDCPFETRPLPARAVGGERPPEAD